MLYNKLGHGKDVCVLNRRDREKKNFVGGDKVVYIPKGNEGLEKTKKSTIRHPNATLKGKVLW